MPLKRRPSIFQEEEKYLPKKHPGASQQPVRVVMLKTCKSTQHFLYIKSNKYAKQKEAIHSSVIDHSDVYMTPFEREKIEKAEARKKFLAGDFRRHSGIASAIPLRKEGAVRVSGVYLPPIPQHHPKDLNTPLYGAWQPAPTNTSSLL